MARDRAHRTFTLEDEAHALLDAVGNISKYVSTLILQHGREWTEAVATLLERGWRSQEIQAACDALRGYGLSNAGRSGVFLSEELARKHETHGYFSLPEVTAVRRQRCFKQLAEDDVVAYALAVVVREYNIPNEACKQAVRQDRAR